MNFVYHTLVFSTSFYLLLRSWNLMDPHIRLRRRPSKTIQRSPVRTRSRYLLRKSSKYRNCHIAEENDNSDKLLVSLNEFRKTNKLCDGTVKCEDGTVFNVHRAVLSAASPFFKSLFLNTLNVEKGEVTNVEIKVPSEVFECILDYAYTGSCVFTVQNIAKVLSYSDQLEIIGLVKLSCDYIIERLDNCNCLAAWRLGKHFFCHNLAERAHKFSKNFFADVLERNPDFCSLEFLELEELLKDDELNVKDEEVVFHAIRKWVEHDVDERLHNTPGLLKCLRYGLMPEKFLNDVVLKWNLIEGNEICKQALAIDRFYLKNWAEEQFTFVDSIKRPRVPYEVLFVIGGWSAGSPTSFIETYDMRADRWLLCMHIDVAARAYHALCVLDGLIYMIGGFDGNEHFNSVRSFNPATGEWRNRACMYYNRCYVSAVTFRGKIYAMGGYNGRIRMSSAERYCPQTNQWELIASMGRHRSDASAAVANNKIYVAGGFNGTEVLRSVEMYDPDSNQWTYVASLSEPRSGVSLVSYNDTLFVFGGFNGHARLQSVERFYPENRKWSIVSHMTTPRSNFAAVVLNNRIYVFGGFNGSTTIGNAEYYVVEDNTWHQVKHMNLNRSALAACVIAGLPNAKDFSYIHKQTKMRDMEMETRSSQD